MSAMATFNRETMAFIAEVERARAVPCSAVHPPTEVCMVCAPKDGEYRCLPAYGHERLAIAKAQMAAERAARPWWRRVFG